MNQGNVTQIRPVTYEQERARSFSIICVLVSSLLLLSLGYKCRVPVYCAEKKSFRYFLEDNRGTVFEGKNINVKGCINVLLFSFNGQSFGDLKLISISLTMDNAQ